MDELSPYIEFRKTKAYEKLGRCVYDWSGGDELKLVEQDLEAGGHRVAESPD